MSANLPSHYVQQFSTNLQLLLQQKGSKLAGTVMSGSHVGKQASPVDQIGAVAAQRVTSRFAPMARVDAPVDRRWVFPVDYDLPQLVDSLDKLRLITDPNSTLVQNAVFAMGRAKDDEILSAMFGTNYTGVAGSTSTAFSATQVVSASQGAAAATGLTVAKLREAKKILMANEVDVDADPLYCIVKAKQLDNLLAEAQIISTEFNDRPVLKDGKIASFLGINFIHCERLVSGTDDLAGTSDQIPLFAKSGMYLGMWNDIQVDISQRKDLQSVPWQAYCMGTFGATRLEEKKIVKVWCR
jgi:hypothetical protein